MPTSFLNILPNPNYGITNAGFEGGTQGQPFSSVKLTSVNERNSSIAMFGKHVIRNVKAQKWNISITYNPMTRAEFEPIFNFLMEKKNTLKPFYVSLPQHLVPNNSGFALAILGDDLETAAHLAGSPYLTVSWVGGGPVLTAVPEAGDFFNIEDPQDSSHKKTYMVTHVETTALYKDPVSANTARIHITPKLQKDVYVDSTLKFLEPLFKVTQVQQIQEYSLGNNNLYSFTLRLEEATY